MAGKTQRSADRELVLVDGCRTPFCKAGTELRATSAADLATHVFREVLDRTGIDPATIDEVILGCAGPASDEANVARVAALRAGIPQRVPAVTVMRNCASGMEALFTAQARLRAGEGEVFLVGGAESMSGFPLLMNDEMVRFFTRLGKARSAVAKVKTLASFRPRFLKPRIAVVEGLTDSVTGLSMGQTAENLAREFEISRQEQDRFAMESHRRAEAALEQGRFGREIAPLTPAPRHDSWVEQDNGVRRGQSLEALAKLKPVFDRHEGDVTVGNACQITDGAVAMLLMSRERADQLHLEPLARVIAQSRAGLDPRVMGLGPVHAAKPALDAAGLELADIDLFEINEAFAAQV
ncbi:MAG: thiolase family protein, partial [Planctomycetes bacterium]|nr:thiolase family protein [Planctomycetota bacterium]